MNTRGKYLACWTNKDVDDDDDDDDDDDNNNNNNNDHNNNNIWLHTRNRKYFYDNIQPNPSCNENAIRKV